MVILDESHSMVRRGGSNSTKRITKAVEAVESLFTNSKDSKIIGLRTFNHRTNLLVPPQAKMDVNITHHLIDVNPIGSTNIGGALTAASEDVAEFALSQGKHLSWTWILVSDGEGDDRFADLKAARKIASKNPHIVCHTIGIDMSGTGERELREIADIFGGQCWIVGQEQLVETVQTAASLAGFKGGNPVGRSNSRSNTAVATMFIYTFLPLVALAVILRQSISESSFLLLLSVIAGILAWGGCEVLLPATGSGVTVVIFIQNGAYFMIAGLALAVMLTSAEGMYLKEPRRAAEQAMAAFPIAVYGGIVAGFMGQAVFMGIASVIFLSAGLIASLVGVFARGIGWAIAGSLVGACPGVSSGSNKQIQNGVIGGFAGGAIGGVLFEIILMIDPSSNWPRMIALATTGFAIAAMVRVVEAYRKEAWLIIEKGGPSGKVCIINKVNTLLGSHYKCDVVVGKERNRTARTEAMIKTDGKIYVVTPVDGGQVMVNGQMVASHHLSPGDMIEVAAGRLSFYCRRSDSTNDYSGPSEIEEDMLLPKTDASDVNGNISQGNQGIDFASSNNMNNNHNKGRKINNKSKDNDSNDDDNDGGMSFGSLEVAGRKVESSSK